MATQDPEALIVAADMVLAEVWNFDAFRGVQEQVIRRLLVDGENALCLMPTGGGKSLCYQVPALCLPGLTVVVSPLIALMKDQVDSLRRRNVAAASMDSSLTPDEMADVRSQLRDKTLKLLYVAPERLSNEMFVQLMMEQEVSLLAVDESHCVSEWGPSFRPEYLKVSRFAHECNAQRVLCLTATATPSVVKDICNDDTGFNIDLDKGVFSTGSYRPNLHLTIKPTSNLASKVALLIPFLQSRGAGGSIVYATTQSDAERVVAALKGKIEARFYHAGVSADERKATQEWFMASQGVVVATIAFGMGLDKADVRQVVHFMLPKTLENYSQEVGRAGRDGLPATCMMMPSAADIPVLESFARGNTPGRNSIRSWLGEVFSAKPASDGAIDFSLYTQSNDYDITRNTLGLLYANLELQCGLLRAGTPFYSVYAIKPSPKDKSRFDDVLNDHSPVARAIRKHWSKGSTWYTLDVLNVVDGEGFGRPEVVRTVNRWEMQGCIETKVSNVRNRYLPLKKMPTTPAEIDEIADRMYQQMLDREEADVKRLKNTAAFVKRDGCFAHGLASYFGDEKSVPNGGECGLCTWCKTRRPITFDPKPLLTLDEPKIQAILNICGVRDDARFLARLAFGISSPRITKLNLSKHPVFRSCETAEFGALVKRFEEECENAGWVNKEVLSAAPPARKGFGTAASKETSGKRPGSAAKGGASKKGKLA